MVSQNKFKLHATTPYWQLQIGLIHNGDLVIEPMVTASHLQVLYEVWSGDQGWFSNIVEFGVEVMGAKDYWLVSD